MSAYIISDTGVVTEFPQANKIAWNRTDSWYATLKRDDDFICHVPHGHLVTFHRPGVVKQAADAKRMALSDSLELVLCCIRNIDLNWTNRKRIKKLKAELAGFDARSKTWK